MNVLIPLYALLFIGMVLHIISPKWTPIPTIIALVIIATLGFWYATGYTYGGYVGTDNYFIVTRDMGVQNVYSDGTMIKTDLVAIGAFVQYSGIDHYSAVLKATAYTVGSTTVPFIIHSWDDQTQFVMIGAPKTLTIDGITFTQGSLTIRPIPSANTFLPALFALAVFLLFASIFIQPVEGGDVA